MRRKPELMQLEIGMSTRRYLPASGTAGLARSRVSGNSRVPCPPPMIIERTLLRLADMRAPLVIGNPFLRIVVSLLYPADPTVRKRQATSNKSACSLSRRTGAGQGEGRFVGNTSPVRGLFLHKRLCAA